jgi:hypothetical protein
LERRGGVLNQSEAAQLSPVQAVEESRPVTSESQAQESFLNLLSFRLALMAMKQGLKQSVSHAEEEKEAGKTRGNPGYGGMVPNLS